jgi:hypothetical protein
MKKALTILLFFACTGCQVADWKPETFVKPGAVELPRKYVLFGAGRYDGELTLALAKAGFQIVPIAMREEVTDFRTSGIVSQYREAGYQFALRFNEVSDPNWGCVTAITTMVDATLEVIDISNNEILAIIKQKGPVSPCPPLQAIWPLLAKDLSELSPTLGK